VNIYHYIDSGIVESYVLGLASPAEAAEFEKFLPLHPVLQDRLHDLELRLEEFALRHQVPPPAGTWELIEDRIRQLPVISPGYGQNGNRHARKKKLQEFIPVQDIAPYIKVHKYYRAAFILFALLWKIFLAFAIYYYLQYRQAEKDVHSLQHQLEKTGAPVHAQ